MPSHRPLSGAALSAYQAKQHRLGSPTNGNASSCSRATTSHKRQKTSAAASSSLNNHATSPDLATYKTPKPPATHKPSSTDTPYQIGSTHLLCRCVQLGDNQLLPVEVIDRRAVQASQSAARNQSLDKAEDSDSDSSEPAAEHEYYVHYTGLDRRLDTWVAEGDLHHKSQHAATPSKRNANGTIAVSPATKQRGTRINKRISDLNTQSSDAVIDANERLLEAEHERKTRVKNIQQIELGDYELDCWYYSPFPQQYRDARKLYVCEWCLKYTRHNTNLQKHLQDCKFRHPPGTEIYRDTPNKISIWEVDGAKHKLYCQCLCLVSKLFIDHKTLYYDVDTFYFYILTEHTPAGHRLVAYFSKEKVSSESNNLACILTFPQFQRKGYGKLLIAVSYALTKVEQAVGSPEKPLSDLGKVSYRSYWCQVIVQYLNLNVQRLSAVTLTEISTFTAIKQDDVISALQALGLIRYVKGEHLLAANAKAIQQHAKQQDTLRTEALAKGHILFDPGYLVYNPPLKQSADDEAGKGTGKVVRSRRGAMNRTSI